MKTAWTIHSLAVFCFKCAACIYILVIVTITGTQYLPGSWGFVTVQFCHIFSPFNQLLCHFWIKTISNLFNVIFLFTLVYDIALKNVWIIENFFPLSKAIHNLSPIGANGICSASIENNSFWSSRLLPASGSR